MSKRDTSALLVLNFTHPLAPDQQEQISQLMGGARMRVLDVPAQFDPAQPFAPQVGALVAAVALSSHEWQTVPIVVNPPALSSIAAAVLAELHGRMGYFPPIIRLRPVTDSLPPRYEVAEILPLQAMRDAARTRRVPVPPTPSDGP